MPKSKDPLKKFREEIYKKKEKDLENMRDINEDYRERLRGIDD